MPARVRRCPCCGQDTEHPKPGTTSCPQCRQDCDRCPSCRRSCSQPGQCRSDHPDPA